jgi:hypothetical protein
MSIVCVQSPVQAQSKTGQNNAIILQNQGVNSAGNRAIILQNQQNNARSPALAPPKASPLDACRGGTACK